MKEGAQSKGSRKEKSTREKKRKEEVKGGKKTETKQGRLGARAERKPRKGKVRIRETEERKESRKSETRLTERGSQLGGGGRRWERGLL